MVGVAVLPRSGVFRLRRCVPLGNHGEKRPASVCGRPPLGIPWGTTRYIAACAVCSRRVRACTRCCGRAGQVVCGGCGFAALWGFQLRRCCLNTTELRALPVCEWPALVMPWGTSRSNAASAVCSRSCEAFTGGYGRGAVQVVCGGAVLPF